MTTRKHHMKFQTYVDLTAFSEPTTLVAHRLTRADLNRYDKASGCFRLQKVRFIYEGIIPKVGDFIVRYKADETNPALDGVVVLVGAGRFYEIVGDKKASALLGTLKDTASCA